MSASNSQAWAKATLGELVAVLDSQRIPLNREQRARRLGNVPYYGATGRVGWIDEALFDEELLLLGEDGAPFLDPHKPKAYIIDGPSWVNNHAHVLHAIDTLTTNSFLKHYLDHIDFRPYVTGTTRLKLTQRAMNSISVPVPTLKEQGRIVATIEEYFSRLNAAEATLSAASRKLDAWLTSFLTDACRGPWPKAQLSDIIKSLNNGVFVSRPSAQPPGSPIYRISAVRPLVLRTDDIRYADPVPKMADAYKVESGDILLTRYSGNPRYVGAAAVVPPGGAGILHPDKLIRVVADRSKALPGWIAAYLTVGEGRRGIEQRLKTTAGQVGISGSQLKTAQIAVPPLSHQQDVVAKIGVVQEAQDRVRQQLDAITDQVQALRRSILADAFSGKLVPQNPDDEPASVLLERIAASRAAKPARRRART